MRTILSVFTPPVLFAILASPAAAQLIETESAASEAHTVLAPVASITLWVFCVLFLTWALVEMYKFAKQPSMKSGVGAIMLIVLAGIAFSPGTIFDLFGSHELAREVETWTGRDSHPASVSPGSTTAGEEALANPAGTAASAESIEDGDADPSTTGQSASQGTVAASHDAADHMVARDDAFYSDLSARVHAQYLAFREDMEPGLARNETIAWAVALDEVGEAELSRDGNTLLLTTTTERVVPVSVP